MTTQTADLQIQITELRDFIRQTRAQLSIYPSRLQTAAATMENFQQQRKDEEAERAQGEYDRLAAERSTLQNQLNEAERAVKKLESSFDADDVSGLLKELSKAEGALSEFEGLLFRSKERLATLSAKGNLQEESVVMEIVRCKAICEVAPARVQEGESLLATAQNRVAFATRQFAGNVVKPLLDDLRIKAMDKARAALKENFEFQEDADAAASNTKAVREIDRLYPLLTEQFNLTDRAFSERLMQVWKDARKMGAKK